tara:strand:+ start:6654 stop:7196 length:543 start_codon:yes stop_codon:yes gene_type:complete
MIYDTPTKADDGMRHVKALTDDKKRCFIQLNDVSVLDVDYSTGEVSIEITGEDNQAKIENVHSTNINSALENSEEWFGKKVSEKAIDKAYIIDDSITAEKIEATKIFTANKELSDFETLTSGTKCSVFIEFAGLWFARSHFGPTWNIVQVKIHEEKTPEVEVPSVDAYPEECMFEDEESK